MMFNYLSVQNNLKEFPEGSTESGPDIATFSAGMTSTAVVWKYLHLSYNLSFKTGFIGAVKDDNTEVFKPVVGWYITFEN